MKRTANIRRHNDWKKAIRKQKIVHNWVIGEYYDNLHQYSKNKIHCSCPLCACKTNNKHRHSMNKNYNPSVHDKKQVDRLNFLLEDYYNSQCKEI